MTEQNQPEQKISSELLDSLKNEIKTELSNKNNKNLPWGNITVTVMLSVLTIVSLAQMMASVNIFNKLKTGEVKASSGSSAAPQSNSPQNAPDMVGGC